MRLLAGEEDLDREPAPPPPEPAAQPHSARWIAGLVGLAAATRVGYLFFFNTPENAGDGATDAYHHWQIAYLTREVGLAHGLRLWDMRGWEYVWGPLHPLLLNVLFFAAGSVDIVLARLLSLAFGLAVVTLIFALCHRYWGLPVAVVAAAFAALSPVSVFNDVAGMAEPIALALLLFGIWLAPRHAFWAGAVWALAATGRVEAWVFGAGLVVALLIGRRGGGGSRAPLVIGWGLGMAAYGLWLLAQTGNPIYPLYVGFQFVGLAAGGTADASSNLALWVLFIAFALVAAGSAAWSVWRRPPSYLLLCFGFGYWALSLATYLRYAAEWKERRFEFPLDFAAILVALWLVRVLPQAVPRVRPLALPPAAVGIAVAGLLWLPVQNAYVATDAHYGYVTGLARDVGAVYNLAAYRGGVLNMPGDEPSLLYFLVRDEGVRGDRVTSQFYDPFHYLPAGYRYADHRDAAGPLLQCWLSRTQTRLLLMSPPGPLSETNQDYLAFIADHPEWFRDVGSSLPSGWSLYAVDVPAPGRC